MRALQGAGRGSPVHRSGAPGAGARVDLAEVGSRRAVLCWDFLTHGRNQFVYGAKSGGDDHPSLIHGNEMLLRRDPDYPSNQTYGVPQHTLEAVSDVLTDLRASGGVSGPTWPDAFDTFVGYLMLDALIGNTDRHHENWGVISQRTPDGHRLHLAPSYDHASSLGRELSDVKRRGRLDSSGRGTLAEYAERGKSAFYSAEGAKLTPFEALAAAARMRPQAFGSWQQLLRGVTFDALSAETERVPESRLSSIGKRFTQELLRHNYSRILQA